MVSSPECSFAQANRITLPKPYCENNSLGHYYLTHTATSGLSEAFGLTPQDAAFSPRNTAGFLPAPQYAVTSTSPTSQLT
jgi:hypothetical protein